MPSARRAEAKLQPDDKTPVQVDKSLSRGDKINFINQCFRHRGQYLATVTNSEKISKAKESQFWLDRRATSTCPFREGTYTTASEIKRIVTGTCTKRRRELIAAGSRLPVTAHHTELQHAMDRWIPVWKLWDTLSHMAKTQTLVLQILGQAEVEHHTGRRLGPVDGPFTPTVFVPEVQEAVGKYVESLRRPWEGTPGEAMYPAEVELWPPPVSTEVDSTDVTTDDGDGDEEGKDAIPSVEDNPPPATSPEILAKLNKLEAAFITQQLRKGKKANAAPGYVSPPSTSPGAPQDSHPSPRRSKHSALESSGHQDGPGAFPLRTFARIHANAEASDTRGKPSPKESSTNGQLPSLQISGFEKRRSANVARIEEATGVKMILAGKLPPKPRQPGESKSKSRPVAPSSGERPISRAENNRVDRGQDSPHARDTMGKEVPMADQDEAVLDNPEEVKSNPPPPKEGEEKEVGRNKPSEAARRKVLRW